MSVEADELAAVFEARGTAYVERPQREGRRSKKAYSIIDDQNFLRQKENPICG